MMRVWVRLLRILTSVAVLAGFIAFETVALNSAARGQSGGSDQSRMVRLVSDPPPGVKPQGQPSFYKADTLYQYIDGGADVYLLYDFQLLLHQEFKSGAAELTVDIYDMGKPEDAFGIYSAERSPNYNYIPLGAEGYRSKGTLNFFQDRYYVKLAGSGTAADASLNQFARTLSPRIGGSRTLPALLLKLPQLQRVKHSEQYIRKDPLGHGFLAPAYVVTYASAGKQGKMLVSVANDAAGAKARLDQLARHFKQTGESTPAPELGEGGIRGKNSFEGTVLARTQGRYLIMLLNPVQNAATFLNAAAAALR
jgi:uncharacterized protein DUF6599